MDSINILELSEQVELLISLSDKKTMSTYNEIGYYGYNIVTKELIHPVMHAVCHLYKFQCETEQVYWKDRVYDSSRRFHIILTNSTKLVRKYMMVYTSTKGNHHEEYSGIELFIQLFFRYKIIIVSNREFHIPVCTIQQTTDREVISLSRTEFPVKCFFHQPYPVNQYQDLINQGLVQYETKKQRENQSQWI